MLLCYTEGGLECSAKGSLSCLHGNVPESLFDGATDTGPVCPQAGQSVG